MQRSVLPTQSQLPVHIIINSFHSSQNTMTAWLCMYIGSTPPYKAHAEANTSGQCTLVAGDTIDETTLCLLEQPPLTTTGQIHVHVFTDLNAMHNAEYYMYACTCVSTVVQT